MSATAIIRPLALCAVLSASPADPVNAQDAKSAGPSRADGRVEVNGRRPRLDCTGDSRNGSPTVIGRPYRAEDYPAPSMAPKYYRLHLELQKELTARSPRGRQVIAERSGHFVHQDQPGLVVEAIRKVS